MKISKKTCLRVFAQLPAEEQWRYFIDGNRHEEGKNAFENNEPGYMNAMLKAYQVMLEGIDKPLTADIILELHKMALSGVENTDNEYLDNFRNNVPGSFGIVTEETNPIKGNTSLQGVQEFLDSDIFNETVIINDEEVNKFKIVVRIDGEWQDISRSRTAEEIYELVTQNEAQFVAVYERAEAIAAIVDKSLQQYHKAIKSAKTEGEKLSAIVELSALLGRRHIFCDGNGRTMVMLVLNRELVKNGFNPTMLDNPTRFGLFSNAELQSDVIRGMQKFWHFASQKKLSGLLNNATEKPKNNEENTVKENIANFTAYKNQVNEMKKEYDNHENEQNEHHDSRLNL